MSSIFESSKVFSDLQIELMVSEIAEILEKLRKNSVYDFDKEKSILLLDREGTRIEFEKTELMEVKRFVALAKGKNIVTIAWNQLSDLSQVEDKESLKQLYFKSDPNAF